MIYLISGLGANDKAYARINLNGRPFIFLPWLKPEKNESFEHYLDRFSKGINQDEEIILIGTSFGGMVAQELAKRFTVKKVILISSIVSEKEFSRFIRFCRMIGLYKVVSPRLLLKVRPFLHRLFGSSSGNDKKFIDDLLQNADPNLITWSINAAINWKQTLATQPKNLFRIHGTKDLVFPDKYIGDAYRVKDGSHLMIILNATEVNRWLNEILDKP